MTYLLRQPTNTPREASGEFVHPNYVATAPSIAPVDNVYVQERARLQIQNERGIFVDAKIIKWKSIDYPIDGADETATIGVDGLDYEKLGGADKQHFAELLDDLSPDRLVRVILGGGAVRGGSGGRGGSSRGSQVLFIGYPMVSSFGWTSRAQTLSATCLSRAQERMRTGFNQQIAGRKMLADPSQDTGEGTDRTSPTVVTVSGLPAVFNEGGKPNRTGAGYRMVDPQSTLGTKGDHTIYLWTTDNAPGAKFWSYADALRAVAWFWVQNAGGSPPINVVKFLRDTQVFLEAGPNPTADDPWASKMTSVVEGVSIQSMNADEAFAVLCDAAGLHYHYPIAMVDASLTGPDPVDRGRGLKAEEFLRVFATIGDSQEFGETRNRQTIAPTVHDLPRDRPFRDYAGINVQTKAELNRAASAQIEIDRRAVNGTTYLGGYTEYEVSLLLRPGWAPHAQLDNITDSEAATAAIAFWQAQFWDDGEFAEVSRIPNSLYHSGHPGHSQVADVFRLWIFPDDPSIVDVTALARTSGFFTADRYNVRTAAGDDSLAFSESDIGGGIAAARSPLWAPHARPFGNTIARKNTATTEVAPIVRIHFGTGLAANTPPAVNDTGWTEFVGDVRILEDRAAIRINEGNMFNGYGFRENPEDILGGGDPDGPEHAGLAIANYIRGLFWVQCTCTVRGDRRLSTGTSFGGSSFTRQRVRVIDTGLDRFRLRYRRQSFSPQAGNSFLQWSPVVSTEPADEDIPEFEDRDDSQALSDLASRERRRIVHDTVAGDLEIIYLDTTFLPGDGISGVDGLGIRFNAYTHVARVAHVNDQGGQRTRLILSDLRTAPELG